MVSKNTYTTLQIIAAIIAAYSVKHPERLFVILLALVHITPFLILYFEFITLLGIWRPGHPLHASLAFPAVHAFTICTTGFLLSDYLRWYLVYAARHHALFVFFFLLVWKSKLIPQSIAYYCSIYKRVAPILPEPKYSPSDVTVCIPTIGDLSADPEFGKCLDSVLDCGVTQIIITTVNDATHDRLALGLVSAKDALAKYNRIRNKDLGPNTIRVVAMHEANKRAQMANALPNVTTDIMAYCDDHVVWPSTYVTSVLAEFEDDTVGMVGTVKRVERSRVPFGWIWSKNFWTNRTAWSNNLRNFFATVYLERHNFECTATYNLDGGVFVMSGRTGFIRKSIYEDADFQRGYLNDQFFGGKNLFGLGITNEEGQPIALKVDDDNHITRWCVDHGHKTVFRNDIDCIMLNSLGTVGGWNKFNAQLLRWARTTWRSNATSLFYSGACWYEYPWTTYVMFIQSLFNIAIIVDGLLVLSLWLSGCGGIGWLLLALALSKQIKLIDHYRREPADILLCWAQLGFGYHHGWVRMHAFFTYQNAEWTGRAGVTV